MLTPDGCLPHNHARRLWSLLDVYLLQGDYFRDVEKNLLNLEALVRPIGIEEQTAFATSGGTLLINPTESSKPTLSGHLFDTIDLLEKNAKPLKFTRTISCLHHLRIYVQHNRPTIDKWRNQEIVTRIKVLRDAFNDDLEEQKIFIPDQNKAERYNQEFPFGEKVFNAFHDARRDVKGAADCYATDNDTACVFHCMRAAEYGLKALAKRLRVSKKKIDKLQWGPIIRDLRRKSEELHQRKVKPSPNREQQLEYYQAAIDKCSYFNNMRDDAMHGRGHYDDADASRALTNVEEFLQLLAKNGLTLPPSRAA
jgi:hypothetical protein